ncbi:MAG: TetR/AcrR family transcriptional regulator [Rubrobacter sp.]|nr:TetR/AcrR family transcriptional regulator [Rubrobacter sp.]
MVERRTQEERREATRRALLASGRGLFAELGYHGASQAEIVARAGMTRGALYHNFEGGKRGLFREVAEEIEVEIDEAVIAAFREEYERGGDMVEAWMAGNLAYLRMCARADVRRILFGDASAALGWEEWREIDIAHGLPQIREGLEALIEIGILEKQPVEPLAHIWYGAGAEAGMYVASAEDSEAAINEMQSALRRVFDGMTR